MADNINVSVIPNNIKVRVGQADGIKVLSSVSGGAARADSATNADNVIGGIADVTTLTVSGISSFVGDALFTNINVSAAATVVGNLTVNDTLFPSQLYVSGLSTFIGVGTFVSDLYVGGDLYVSDDLVFDEFTARSGSISETLSVTGTATFSSDLDINGSIDVDGNTELDDLNVSGQSTFVGLVDINGGGQANSFVVEDLTNNRIVIVGTNGELEDDENLTFDGTQLAIGVGFTVTGVSTFASDVDINGNVDIDGHTELDNLNVSGIATLGVTTLTDVTAQQLNVSGITTLGITTLTNVTAQQLNVSGVSTLGITTLTNVTAQQLNVSGVTTTTTLKVGTSITASGGIVTATSFSTGAVGTGINIGLNSITGPSDLIIDPAAVGDDTGRVTIKGDLFVLGSETSVSSQTIELADHRVGIATTVGTNLLLNGGGIGIGSANILKTFTYDNAANTLKSSVGLGVTSGGEFKTGTNTVLNSTTLGSGVINSSLTSVGTLINLNVGGATTFTGISTFSSNVNIAGTLTAGEIDGGIY